MKKLFIFGGSSTALEIYEIVQKDYDNKFGEIFFVIGDHEKKTNDIQISDSELSLYTTGESYYIISFVDNNLRKKVRDKVKDLNISPINIVSSSSYIFDSAIIGVGNFINSYCILSANSIIGDHNILNFSSQVGHYSKIGDDVILNPGARISGNCIIGSRILIGSNSVILQEKVVGNDTSIDALTYIDKDIEPGKICSSKNLKIFDRIDLKKV